jgi:hypothetical protein
MIAVARSQAPVPDSESLTDHEILRARTTRIRELLNRAPASETLISWRAYLCSELEDFEAALARHFEEEEVDGAFHELTERRPDLRSLVEHLGHQHRSILMTLDSVRQRLGRQHTTDLIASVSALLDRFDAHEREENELLQMAHCLDLGAGG